VVVVFIVFIVSLLLPCFVPVAAADDAVVLPKGRFSLGVENRFYFPTDERFGPHGRAEELAGAFNNRNLDASVFPSLSALNPLVPGGRASIGESAVHFEYHYNILAIAPAYGVTDRLTVYAEIPYYWVHNDVHASVNSAPGSGANVGLRTGPGPGPCALPVAVLPLTCPNTRRFTTEDVQQILGPGLPGITGFGFKRIEDFSAEGIGDITLAAKYQFLRSEDWLLAATAGVRFPTGRQDDPDNLTDIPWSTGAYTLLARLHADYALSNLWTSRTDGAATNLLKTGSVVLNFTFRYDWILRDQVTIRAGAENALPTFRARVHRDIGDRFEFEIGGRYIFWSPFSVSGLYRYAFKLEDRIAGPKTFPHNFAEEDTDSTEHLFIAQLNFSTVQWYLQHRFPVPLNLFINYRDRFAGSGPRAVDSPSQIIKTRYIGVGLQVIF
jgi:hypothetical protein